MKVTDITPAAADHVLAKDIPKGVPYRSVNGGHFVNISVWRSGVWEDFLLNLKDNMAFPLKDHPTNGDMKVAVQYPDHELVLRKG